MSTEELISFSRSNFFEKTRLLWSSKPEVEQSGKMSFIDLATLALHRRNEMEDRIKSFVSKCDQAIDDIVKLKLEAQGFVHMLNCEPSELKERFLYCMKTLEEYSYLITDFNLSVGKLAELKGSVEYTPVHDISSKLVLTPNPTYNIMDMLSEPAPSTSRACPNFCPLEHKPRKVSKEEQTLITFSSTSCSSESMPLKNEVAKREKEVQCQLTEEMKAINITNPVSPSPSSPLPSEQCNLPAQTVLETDHIYPATIMHIDGPSLWVITEDTDAVATLIYDMTNYYKTNHTEELSLEEIKSLTFCAYYDDDSDSYYRGLFIGLSEEDMTIAEVFLVDTGEVRSGAARGTLQPLAARFCTQPPYARCCHLAGVDMLSSQNKELAEKQEKFLSMYVGIQCNIEVDDNNSESLGVFVILPNKEILNDLLIRNGLACLTPEKAHAVAAPRASSPAPTTGPPELTTALSDSQFDISCPEYNDPVEAVTGYSNRDEAEVCKHYRGGPEKTCFKGPRCKKRHILLHPDGWTLDKMEVVGKCLSVPLPAPGTWLRALVTCVAHFDRLFVQITKEKDDVEDEPLPDFGVILPPMSLDALVRDMNSPGTRTAYKPLNIMPAVGELVAALYPPDNQWYRARVLSVTRADQNVEVMYIDYGNMVWVKEDAVRKLEPRFTSLPAQAVRCVLAGVSARGHDSRHWAAAKQQLSRFVQDRTLDVHVIGRGYDEITVEMFDEQGYSVAEQLAATNMVELKEYAVQDDRHVAQKLVVP